MSGSPAATSDGHLDIPPEICDLGGYGIKSNTGKVKKISIPRAIGPRAFRSLHRAAGARRVHLLASVPIKRKRFILS